MLAACRAPQPRLIQQRSRGMQMTTMRAQGTGGAPGSEVVDIAVWLLRGAGDMRLADNPALVRAAACSRTLLPLLCIDPADLAPRSQGRQQQGSGSGGGGDGNGDSTGTPSSSSAVGVPLLGPHKLRLLLEAAHSLRHDLEARGSGLAFAVADPADALRAALTAAAPAARAAAPSAAPAGARPRPPRAALLLAHAPAGDARTLGTERAAAAAFAAAARRLGMDVAGVEGAFDAALHHPDDLPYAAFAGQKEPPRQQEQQQQQQQAAEGSGGGGAMPAPAWWEPGTGAPAPNADARRFAPLPRTMTEFRRRLAEAGRAPRAPAPAPAALPPLPAGVRGGGGDSGGSSSDAMAGWWAPLPADVASVYAAGGPAAAAALRRLAELTSRPELAAAGGVVPRYAGGAPPPNSAFPFEGGEAAAHVRLRGFLGSHAALASYGESRMMAAAPGGGSGSGSGGSSGGGGGSGGSGPADLDASSSAKLSPYLALGCLTARQVAAEVGALRARLREQKAQQRQQAEGQQQQWEPDEQWREQQQQEQQLARGRGRRGAKQAGATSSGGDPSEGCAWLVMHLEIRDHFIYSGLRAGDRLVAAGDSGGDSGGGGWRDDPELFARWAAGRTGFPFVDAVRGRPSGCVGGGWVR